VGLKLFSTGWSLLADSCQQYGHTETLVSKIGKESLSEYQLIKVNSDPLIFFAYLFIYLFIYLLKKKTL
jgi:hypothetical protein